MNRNLAPGMADAQLAAGDHHAQVFRRSAATGVAATGASGSNGKETDSLLEGAGFEPSVPRKARPTLGYSLLIMKSLSAADSAPQTSPLRPASCRTLAWLSGRGKDTNFSGVGSKRRI